MLSCFCCYLRKKEGKEMAIERKRFEDVNSDEFFIDSHFTQIFEHDKVRDPNIPFLYRRIGKTNQAIFLPTGRIMDFPPNTRVTVVDVKIEVSS